MPKQDCIQKVFKDGYMGGTVAVSLEVALSRLAEVGKEKKKVFAGSSFEGALEEVLEEKAVPIISGLLGTFRPENIEALRGIEGLERKIWRTYWELVNDPECPSDFNIFVLIGELINNPPLTPVTA